MDINDNLVCLCGKRFVQLNAATNHRRKCTGAKARVTNLLNNLKNLREALGVPQAKRLKLTPMPRSQVGCRISSETPFSVSSHQLSESELKNQKPDAYASSSSVISTTNKVVAIEEYNSDLSIAERRELETRETRQPARFRDFVSHPSSPKQTDSDLSNPSQDNLPESPPYSIHIDAGHTTDSDENSLLESSATDNQPVLYLIQSSPDRHRVWRVYYPRSECDLIPECEDDYLPDEHSSESPKRLGVLPDIPLVVSPELKPYPNLSSFLLGEWYWNGSMQKSHQDFENLIRILRSHTFDVNDIQKTSWRAIDQQLGTANDSDSLSNVSLSVSHTSGWKRKEITIQVPFHHRLGAGIAPGPRPFLAGELQYRSIVSVVREKITKVEPSQFEFTPYAKYWSPFEGAPPQRIYDELYTSSAFLEAYETLQKSPPEVDCNLPRVIVGLMFASDETHLTQFGETKLWPLYMYFGNESKYERCKPSGNHSEHMAYFTKLPDTFKDFLLKHLGDRRHPSSVISHCVREVLHAQWKELLDDEFIMAYQHGIVVTCLDGIQRRFYLRIFTYSADYKEKTILAGIRPLAMCPCPRCCVPLREAPNMGTPVDRAWREISKRHDDSSYRELISGARSNLYDQNYAIDGDYVDKPLRYTSLLPTENAFSARLSCLGFDFFEMFVVDLMHEIESGNWKALFIHLLRILHCCEGPAIIHEVDKRFRSMPTFGRDTIRKFQRNMTEMKNLAARDWEDMLQCAIPVFESLLPEPHNSVILDLLFTLAYWHGLAKLRMHTDATLKLLDNLTTDLGNNYRHFKATTCNSYQTQELPREANARARRAASSTTKKNSASTMRTTNVQEVAPRPKRLFKEFNMRTYKFHAFGDYVATIKRFGTTDSYSTETGELEHRESKTRYKRTSKKNYVGQISKIERRQSHIRQIRAGINKSVNASTRAGDKPCTNIASSICTNQPGYKIGKSEDNPLYLADFLHKNASDPATKGFLANLKAHLLPRARCLFKIRDDSKRITIFFHRDRIYCHKTMRLTYMGYDTRVGTETINPNGANCNIMLLRTDLGEDLTEHPFLYAKVLGVFHANVISACEDMDPAPQRIDFLWVRWYQHQRPSKLNRFDRLKFYPLQDDSAFGFVDPNDVIRACHITPSLSAGQRHQNPADTSPSEAFWYPKQRTRIEQRPLSSMSKGEPRGLSKLAQDRYDWNLYYVNPFADRDILMRYHWGMGVGHGYFRAFPGYSYQFNHGAECDDNGADNSVPCSESKMPLDSEMQPEPATENLVGGNITETYPRSPTAGLQNTMFSSDDMAIAEDVVEKSGYFDIQVPEAVDDTLEQYESDMERQENQMGYESQTDQEDESSDSDSESDT